MPESKPSSVIRLRGVRHNNLKNFDLDLPLHQLIVTTGSSGPGKSWLAVAHLGRSPRVRKAEIDSGVAGR